MYHFAIVREGEKDDNLYEGGPRLQDIEENFVKSGIIVFVGMYTLRKDNETITIYSLPKYYPRNQCTEECFPNIQNHIKKICKVVEELRKIGKNLNDEEFLFDPFEHNTEEKKVNRCELAEYIVEDYLQNGLYVRDLTETKKGGVGRTVWGKTVTKIQPIFQNNIPIYHELINRHHRIDEDDLIKVIHANVLNQCIDFMGPLISYGIEYIETEPLGENLSDFASIIKTQSSFIFKEREINLFKALEAWCTSTRYYKNYAGVTCFDRVWEWVNDFVWGNIKHPESNNPEYNIYNKTYRGNGDAIPDTVRIEEIGDKNEVFIYDSKYYTVKKLISKDKYSHIEGFPANSDIVKQVAYLKLIKSQYVANKYFNAFLLPETSELSMEEENEMFTVPYDKWFSTIGYVKPGDFNLPLSTVEKMDDSEEKVGIIIINPDKLYDKYLKKIKANKDDLCETKTYLDPHMRV